MKEIKPSLNIASLLDDSGEAKIKIILTKFSDVVYKLIRDNFDVLTRDMSKPTKRLFTESFNKKSLNPKMLKVIFRNMDKDLQDNLVLKIAAKLVGASKADDFISQKLTKEDFLKLTCENERIFLKDSLTLFDIYNDDLLEEIIERNAELKKMKADEKRVSDLERQLRKLTEDNKTLVNEKQKDAEQANNKILKLVEENQKLKNDNKELTNKITKAKEQSLEKVVIHEDLDDTVEKDSYLIGPEKLLSDIESRCYVGYVPEGGININGQQKMIVIKPSLAIVGNYDYIDKQGFIDRIEYRGDYSTFVCLINQRFISEYLEDEVDDFFYLSEDEQYNILYEKFSNKVICFKPIFKELPTRVKYVLNADIVGIFDLSDFKSPIFVPQLDISTRDFESKIEKGEDFEIDSFPMSLSQYLKYVVIGQTIYYINCVPSREGASTKRWKSKEKSFDKHSLKSFQKTDYIKMPDGNYYFKFASLLNVADNSDIFDEKSFVENVSKNALSQNLCYSLEDLKNFHIAIKSSQLVILSGLSGTGKSKLPIIYGNTLGLREDNGGILFVPISPSYLEPEDILGYVRPIIGENYNAEFLESSTGLVSFLIDAANHTDKLHLVIFDEMNLSQIEHWFSPFISILEKDPNNRKLKLYSEKLDLKNSNHYPSNIEIGRNVIFIGTINVDETTKVLSDRLNDRAFIINLDKMKFDKLKEMGTIQKKNYREVSFDSFQSHIQEKGDYINVLNDREIELFNKIDDLMSSHPYGKGISYRTLKNVSLYLANSQELIERSIALDYVILQFIVKRLNGTELELSHVLTSDQSVGLFSILQEFNDLSEFKKSKEAITSKIKELSDYGYTK